ncbi:hypothetical protein [Nitratifractor sp.]
MIENYQIVEELTAKQVEKLYELYRQEWWTRERSREQIEKMLKHPDLPEVLQFNLQCKEEMTAFYERFGFTRRLGDLFYMRRTASR